MIKPKWEKKSRIVLTWHLKLFGTPEMVSATNFNLLNVKSSKDAAVSLSQWWSMLLRNCKMEGTFQEYSMLDTSRAELADTTCSETKGEKTQAAHLN